MKKWKNPYLTLKLSPFASSDDIRDAGKVLSSTEQDNSIVRSAREELTQNVNIILPAFLTAVDDIVSMERELKQLRKINQITPKINEEIKKDAFTQIGINLSEPKLAMSAVDIADIAKVSSNIGIKELNEDIIKNEKASLLQISDIIEIKSADVSIFNIPQIIK